MERLLRVMALALIVSAPEVGHAAPPVNWQGPPCQWGAAKFKVCSTEPGNVIPCYVSRSASYTPNRVELALIEVCQRTKAALTAPPTQRDDALGKIVNAELDLKEVIENNPGLADDNQDDIKNVAKDMTRLGARTLTYADDPVSRDGWADIAGILHDLEARASVETGPIGN